MDGQPHVFPEAFELVPMHMLESSVCVSPKGYAVLGKKNQLICGLEQYESTPYYIIRVLNIDSRAKYILSFDPSTSVCCINPFTPTASHHSLVEVPPKLADEIFVNFRIPGTPPRFLRHSNSLLRFDAAPPNDSVQFFLDSGWILRKVSPSKVRRVPDFSWARPTLVVRDLMRQKTQNTTLTLLRHAQEIFLQDRVRERTSTRMYALQGAGGAGELAAPTQAVDFRAPGVCEYPAELRKRVEASSTIRERGGVSRFGSFVEGGLVELAMIDLISEIEYVIEKNEYLYDNSRKFSIGFIEFIHQPPGRAVTPHIDGANDCDFAANYALLGPADVTVEEKQFRLNPGDVYIFRPHEQRHAVDPPLDELNGRFIISIRYFFI